jgi:hypothetical protein
MTFGEYCFSCTTGKDACFMITLTVYPPDKKVDRIKQASERRSHITRHDIKGKAVIIASVCCQHRPILNPNGNYNNPTIEEAF